jgi:hypothetical protein
VMDPHGRERRVEVSEEMREGAARLKRTIF